MFLSGLCELGLTVVSSASLPLSTRYLKHGVDSRVDIFTALVLNSDDLRRRKTLGVRMMPGSGVFLPMKRVVPLDAMAMVDDDLLSDAGALGS